VPYTPHSWANGDSASAARLNNIETQYTEASNSFQPYLLQPFVLSGMVCTKDGTTANQLDVTAGVACLLQTDSTLRQRTTVASTGGQFTTSAISATYYLDLNPDGTWSFATSHSGVANYLSICQVTTDASGNILAVTDERVTTINFFSGALATGASINGNAIVTSAGGSLTLSSLTVTGVSTFDTNPLVQVTLSGSNKKVLEMKATDGDDFGFVIETTNSLLLYNYTTSTSLGIWTNTGTYQSPCIEATSTASFGGGNYSFIATASTGAIYSDNGNFKTSGSGTVTANQFNTTDGNAGFNCRGNSSGTGSGTYSHGAGTTPNIVLAIDSQSSASMTVGTAAYSSTQYTLTAGASHTFKAVAL
jgi:hypothetical protein